MIKKKYTGTRWAVFFLFCVFLFLGCKKKVEVEKNRDEIVEKTKVIADSVSTVGITTAIFSGKITGNFSNITDRGVYFGKSPNPTGNKTTSGWYTSSGQFKVELNNLTAGTTYYIKGYATNSNGTVYSQDIQFKTLDKPANQIFITTDTLFATGVSTAFVAGGVTIVTGVLAETGICISENPDPVITGRKITSPGVNDIKFFLRVNELKEATRYYIRAYGTDDQGKTYYGNNVQLSTILKGNITWSLIEEDPNADFATKEAYGRIRTAFDKAVDLMNNFTSIEKHLSVKYSPGTPTADGNISGWINVGSNSGYQRTGTALHEIGHTVGVGTHWLWPQLMVNGFWQGIHANRNLQVLTGNRNAKVMGDKIHFWPYGINGSWEDSGVEIDYIITCMILQGMKKDGLPSYW